MFAITIGKFEALHRGHNYLITTTIEYARKHGLKSGVLSFVPHPARILVGDEYKPLYSKKEQAFLIENYDIDRWIPYPFDRDFAGMSPLDFCHMLRDELNCRALIVGEGFRFGRNREGTLNSFRPLSIEVIEVPDCEVENEKVSTSQIRDYLAAGRVQEANKRLTRPFFIMGEVQKGRQIGRVIGFPTANMHPDDDKFLPPDGVYASGITVRGQALAGVTNIGTNPTVVRGSMRKVETHIFGFDADIYDEEVIVELYDFIRAERVFGGLEELKKQIAEDSEKAKRRMSFLEGRGAKSGE